MPNDRRERIELALDMMVSFGKLLGSHVLGLKYDGMVVVMAPIVRYDPSLIFETLIKSQCHQTLNQG
jgi:L-rhamnose isomerase